MLRTKPRLSYCGLTIILSNPSRFDKVSLLTANGGELFNNHCLRPEFNVMQCDIRLADDNSFFLEGTKCILLLGSYAMHKWLPRETGNNTLNEMRGSLFHVNGITTIPSFFPQDAADIKSHEQNLNKDSKEFVGRIDKEQDDEEDADEKRYSNTKRSNYAFWLKRDVWKCKQILKNPNCYKKSFEPIYKIYPSSQEVINILTKTKGQWMDFDIETDYEQQNLLCFSFSFDGGRTVYAVPVLNHNYQWAYSSLHYIMRALCIAVRDNIMVAHNGAAFDFLVLGYKYHIPINRVWDTMIAMHRCFPDIEKSLGHSTSYWTWENFHKDMGNGRYFTQEDMMNMLKYCAKDVFTMSLIRQGIQSYAKTIPGLENSIKVAMESIKPYLIVTLQGIKYDEEMRQSLVRENDRLMMQYLRMINLLIGEKGIKEMQTAVKGKAGAMPNSNPQCVKYFHEQLGYPVVMRSEPDKKGQRNPSLAKKAMFTLRLKHENPVIDLVNIFRCTRLEVSTPLGFKPFKDDNNQVIQEQPVNKNTNQLFI